MIKRREPPSFLFSTTPCSMVAVGTATGSYPPVPAGLHPDGYLPLAAMNRYVRGLLPVAKSEAFRRGQRPSLKEFLETNTGRAVILVEGHFVFAEGRTYWSFLRNAHDPVVHVWRLKEAKE